MRDDHLTEEAFPAPCSGRRLAEAARMARPPAASEVAGNQLLSDGGVSLRGGEP